MFFDGIVDSGQIRDFGYAGLLDSLHERDIKAVADTDKKAAEALLQEELEKLNRWKYDEVYGIRLAMSSVKNKILALHKKLFYEKIVRNKVELQKQIKKLEEKYEMGYLTSLEKEKAINLTHNRLVEKKKQALKFAYSSELVFDCTFEVC